VCRSCGHSFHVVSNPPRRDGICDLCGGELYQRVDDAEATVRNRLQVYQEQTAPLLDWYTGKGLLASIQGAGTIGEINERVKVAARRRP